MAQMLPFGLLLANKKDALFSVFLVEVAMAVSCHAEGLTRAAFILLRCVVVPLLVVTWASARCDDEPLGDG